MPEITEADCIGIVLRRATEEDSSFLFTLRNDPSVIASSFTPQTVTTAEHRGWLTRSLASPERILYVVEYQGEAVGQLRFDLVPGEEAEVSIAIVSTARGKGIAHRALVLGSQEIFHGHAISRIKAYILSNNKVSVATFKKAGFGEPESVMKNGKASIVMELVRKR